MFLKPGIRRRFDELQDLISAALIELGMRLQVGER